MQILERIKNAASELGNGVKQAVNQTINGKRIEDKSVDTEVESIEETTKYLAAMSEVAAQIGIGEFKDEDYVQVPAMPKADLELLKRLVKLNRAFHESQTKKDVIEKLY